MKIVVDTSVIIAVITNEIHKAQLMDVSRNAQIIAPHSLHWEVGNAFSAMLKRGRITLDQVKIALNEYKKIPIKFHDPDLNLVLELCLDFNLYAYDAYFLQCAKDLRAPLLTLDKQMSENAVKIDIDIIEVIK